VNSSEQPHSLVIGGTRGIGRAVAQLLARENHRVSVVGRKIPQQTLDGVHYKAIDLLDETNLQAGLEQIVRDGGPLSNLVFLQRFKSEGDAWAGELATSLTATKRAIEFLVPHFCGGGSKSIVLVSSAASNVVADEQGVGYHVAKAGINQMARYYAVVLGPKGFRVNVVSPGTVLKQENRDFYLNNEKLRRVFERAIPLGRMGTADEAANVIEFLCSSKASFVTGQTILVDGGVNLISTETLARKLID